MIVQPEAHLFEPSENIPNNPALPLLIYKQAVTADADVIEKILPQHKWEAAWRYGIYPFAHFHSTVHEFLAVYRGHATLRLGHLSGITVEVQAGDVIVIPAGVGHQNLGSSPDFHVVGGYPLGQEADLLKNDDGPFLQAPAAVAKVPLPAEDPLYGSRGPLMKLWK